MMNEAEYPRRQRRAVLLCCSLIKYSKLFTDLGFVCPPGLRSVQEIL